MKPTLQCRVGDQKKTPAGSPLSGEYTATHWYCDLPHVDGLQLSVFLQSVVKRLGSHRHFLQEICASGGSLEISIGWYSGINSGDEFQWALLKELSDLQISVSLDIYADAVSLDSASET